MYVIPESERLGWLTNEATDYVYPLIDTVQNHKFIIDEEGKLKEVKFTNKPVEKKEKPIIQVPDEELKMDATDPLEASEEIVGAGITNEEIEEIINQTEEGASVE